MGNFRKLDLKVHVPRFYPIKEEIRSKVAKPNGGFDVVFEKVDAKVISDQQLDPSLIDMDWCIRNNTFIDPRNFSHIFDYTDPESIEALNGRISEESFAFLKNNMKDWDFSTNTKKSDKS